MLYWVGHIEFHGASALLFSSAGVSDLESQGFGILKMCFEVCFAIAGIGWGLIGSVNDIFVSGGWIVVWQLFGLPRMLTWNQRKKACSVGASH